MTKKEKLVKAFFFDLDGTLCDTDRANYIAYKEACKKEGYILEEEDFYRVNGNRADKFIPMLFPEITKKQVDNIRQNKALIYPGLLHETRPNTELIDFLKIMKPHHKLVLVTTAARKNAEHILRHTGLEDSFDQMIFGEDIINPKPAPDVYLYALKETELSADEVVAFEDSVVGIEAATSAGIKTVRVKI